MRGHKLNDGFQAQQMPSLGCVVIVDEIRNCDTTLEYVVRTLPYSGSVDKHLDVIYILVDVTPISAASGRYRMARLYD